MYFPLIASLCFSFYACANAGKYSTAIKQNFLLIGEYNDCEGKHAANYTFIVQYQSDPTCTIFTGDTFDALIQKKGKKEEVISMQPLVASTYPDGANSIFECLYLITGGPLQGKYAYEKTIGLVESYMKKCSSVLGLLYIKSKSSVLLISDKLDLKVLLSSTGAFHEFKKGSNTECNGVVTAV